MSAIAEYSSVWQWKPRFSLQLRFLSLWMAFRISVSVDCMRPISSFLLRISSTYLFCKSVGLFTLLTERLPGLLGLLTTSINPSIGSIYPIEQSVAETRQEGASSFKNFLSLRTARTASTSFSLTSSRLDTKARVPVCTSRALAEADNPRNEARIRQAHASTILVQTFRKKYNCW